MASLTARKSTQRYVVFNNKRSTFFEAWRACMSLGLRLATVNSAQDDAALLVALRDAGTHHKGPWYIAGTDLGKEGSFVWLTTNREVGYGSGYVNWQTGEPSNSGGNEHCIESAVLQVTGLFSATVPTATAAQRLTPGSLPTTRL
ncbi:salivary C-type lectin [Culex quinquefasciatus]|uniref:Salivary C-type lectin n=1 Tax=Culex quinquefasciatus TaxID=7176 RepID=B0X9Y1_CULQU|nr:salivary C-type lectin [Culex quinquefasciatus]|eukprot:XP_001866453.1 salivary C-type lectin [Culex quinquefasciatus]